MRMGRLLGGVLLWSVVVNPAESYPLDGYQESGIHRLQAPRRMLFGEAAGSIYPPGALLSTESIELKLVDYPDLEIPEPDLDFTRQVVSFLANDRDSYGIAVLDVTNPKQPRYAEYQANRKQNVGSVGKIVVALAVFQALADIYPTDIEARKRVLRETQVTADDYLGNDSHRVVFWDSQTKTFSHRSLRIGDQASLWEYMDWMLSVSSNAAAAMVMEHAMLLVNFGEDYPVSQVKAERALSEMDKKRLTELFSRTFQDPIVRNGLNPSRLRQGSFFSTFGKRHVPSVSSYGTARELVRFLLMMEQGRLVDVFSSREMKRLLYLTERRIRYASSPALVDAAVYFKSGSLYRCKPEPRYLCKKYQGNVLNYMNSVAIVEASLDQPQLHYLTGLTSNVLYKNSAVDHQTLATRIHRLIKGAHLGKSSTKRHVGAKSKNAILSKQRTSSLGSPIAQGPWLKEMNYELPTSLTAPLFGLAEE